jgi:dihydrofolate reductase
VPYADESMLAKAQEGMSNTRALLFGRFTYEAFHSYWPHQSDNPFTDVLNKTQKYVASTTLAEPLPWVNSTLLGPDVPKAVAELKEQPGGDIVILGCGELARSLMPHRLIDEYILLIHPVVLGQGSKLFQDGVPFQELTLADSVSTSKGVILATYRAQ